MGQANIAALGGAHPTNDISIEFKIIPTFEVLWFKIYSADHKKILHTSRQYNCRDVCKLSSWSDDNISNYSTPNFDQISNSIEIPLVGQGPDTVYVIKHSHDFILFCYVMVVLQFLDQWGVLKKCLQAHKSRSS